MKDSTPLPDHAGTIVIGAGLGGLLAAVTAAEAAPGSDILVLDPHPAGGRARCDDRHGFTFNRGPRALFAAGVADCALRAAGVDTGEGGKPILTGAAALHDGVLHRFPSGPLDSLRTTLLTAREKVALSTLLAALWRADPASTEGLTVSGWLDDRGATGRVRQLLEALIRVGTYVDAPDRFAAGPALANAKLGISPGVRYLDGGWQSLVDQLLAIAASRGITFGRAAAISVRPAAGGRVEVATPEGATIRAGTAVIAAGGPDQAASLLGETPASWGVLAPPVTAACLELGLAAPPRRRFALGIDVPLYASTHAPPARLAPPGHAVVHLMRYQRPGDDQDATAQREELLAFARQVGIAERDVVTERFLAKMTVAGTLPAAAAGGFAGRPAVVVAEHPGVLLVGDWVGPTGLLLDAVAASATDAGRRAAARSASMVPA